jgi:thiamine pyrophosphate-dependent acetolactate synthase large subunit-like protein
MIVFDNSLLDTVHWEMLAEGFEPFQTDLKNPDFAKLDCLRDQGVCVVHMSPQSVPSEMRNRKAAATRD